MKKWIPIELTNLFRQHCRLNICRYIGCIDKYCICICQFNHYLQCLQIFRRQCFLKLFDIFCSLSLFATSAIWKIVGGVPPHTTCCRWTVHRGLFLVGRRILQGGLFQWWLFQGGLFQVGSRFLQGIVSRSSMNRRPEFHWLGYAGLGSTNQEKSRAVCWILTLVEES